MIWDYPCTLHVPVLLHPALLEVFILLEEISVLVLKHRRVLVAHAHHTCTFSIRDGASGSGKTGKKSDN